MKSERKKRYLAKNINKEFIGRLTIGQRAADKIASFGGSWPFLFAFAFVLFLWMSYQTLIAHNKSFDPYPYILLNLILSCLASIQAPVIMMSQNRQVQKDRLQADHDFEINLKAEKEIEHIQEELDLIRDAQNSKMLKSLEEIKSLLSDLDKQLHKD